MLVIEAADLGEMGEVWSVAVFACDTSLEVLFMRLRTEVAARPLAEEIVESCEPDEDAF